MAATDYVMILWQRKFVIASTTLIVMLVAFLGTLFTAPVYEATTKLQVSTAPRGSLDFIDYNLDYTDRLMNTYIHIAQSGPVLDQLVQNFHLPERPVVDVTIIANTELMRLSVAAANAHLASNLANALAKILVDQTELGTDRRSHLAQTELDAQLAQVEGALTLAQQAYDRLLNTTPRNADKIISISREIDLKKNMLAALTKQMEELRVRDIFQNNLLTIVDPALPPQRPLYPDPWVNLLLGLTLGLIGGVGLAFLFEHFDDRLRSSMQIAALTQTIILGEIPKVKRISSLLFFKESSLLSNALLRIYTNLQARQNSTQPKVLLVTSTQPAEGKSTIVTGLAHLLAQGGQRVIAIDCNLRAPQLHEYFKIANQHGLSNVLQQQVTLEQALCATIAPLLKLLPSGTSQDSALITFRYPLLATLVQQLKQQADIILLDAPAFGAAPEFGALAALADGVVLVVNARQVRPHELAATSRELQQLHTTVIGAIINCADTMDGYVPRAIMAGPPQLPVEPLTLPAQNRSLIQHAFSKKG